MPLRRDEPGERVERLAPLVKRAVHVLCLDLDLAAGLARDNLDQELARPQPVAGELRLVHRDPVVVLEQCEEALGVEVRVLGFGLFLAPLHLAAARVGV
jgi:hypothetical protein